MKRTQNYFVWGCFPKSLEIAIRDLLSSRVRSARDADSQGGGVCASNDQREVGLKSARLGSRLVATLETIRIASPCLSPDAAAVALA